MKMMIDSEEAGFFNLLKIGIPELLFTAAYASFIITIEEIYGDTIYSLPSEIGSVLGLAVAFFLGFRMNSAYDRWWEARKIIGEFAANSRKFSSKVVLYSQKLFPDVGRQIIDILIEYNSHLTKHLLAPTSESKQKSLHLLQKISSKVETAFGSNTLEKFDLLQIINNLHDIQGKAERTKFTPFLNIYKSFTRIMVYSYVLLLPFFVGDIDLGGEHSFLEFLAIPLTMLFGYIFLMINKLANMYGDPFNGTKTSLPMEKISFSLNKDLEMIKNLSVKAHLGHQA